MTPYNDLNLSILSGKLKPKARKWKTLRTISILAFLLLPYPLIKFLGDSIMCKIIIGLIILFFFFFIIVFHYINKFEVIGRLIINLDGIKVKKANEKRIIEIENIKEIYFDFNGYWDQPFKYGPKLRTEAGNGNFLRIGTKNEIIDLELFLKNGSETKLLSKYLDYFKQMGINTNVVKI